MLTASTIGQIVHPFYVAFAWLLSTFYDFIPNYAIAIALLTLTVMVLVFPLTLKGTRGMLKMQLLQPQMRVIQQRYKAKAGSSLEERQEARAKLNEELMALYKENGVSPVGGCLPQFLPLPFFMILYGTIRGLTYTYKGAAAPRYLSTSSKLYKNIVAAHGELNAFGINLAHSVKSAGSWGDKLPYVALILVAVGLQYLQMKQISGRNPGASNPQMQTMQRVMPLIMSLIYISIPAGVNVYFIVSSLFRVGQQGAMYRWDPHLASSMSQLRDRATTTPAPAPMRPQGGFRERIRQAQLASQGLTGDALGSSDSNGSTAEGKGPKYTPPRVRSTTTPSRSRDKRPRKRR